MNRIKAKVYLVMVCSMLAISLTGCAKVKDMLGMKGESLNEETNNITPDEVISDESNSSSGTLDEPIDSNNPNETPIEEEFPSVTDDMNTENQGEQSTDDNMIQEDSSNQSTSPTDSMEQDNMQAEQNNTQSMESLFSISIDGTTRYNINDLINSSIDQTLIDKVDMIRAGILSSDGVTVEEEYKPIKTEEVIFRVFKVDGSYKDYKVTFKLDKSKAAARSFKDRNPNLFKWSKGKHIWRRLSNSLTRGGGWKGSWDGEVYISEEEKSSAKDISNKIKYEKEEEQETPSESTSNAEPAKLKLGDDKGSIELVETDGYKFREDGADRAIITIPNNNQYLLQQMPKSDVDRYKKDSIYNVNDFDFRQYTIRDFNPKKRGYGTSTKYLIQFKLSGVDKEFPYFYVIKNNENYFILRCLSVYEGNEKEMENVLEWLRKGE